MCGVSGIIDLKNRLSEDIIKNFLVEFNNILAHRGPNNSGIYINKNIGLAQTRLSIIDLSQNGKQPMISNDKENIISYNGEVYNFLDLKKNLTHINFKSNTDTEVVLEYLSAYGHQKFMSVANGMYAISLFDKKENCLYLIRDKIGKKPLYYFKNENYLIWGSEINIFFNSPIKKQLVIDQDAVQNYFDVGYIPAPLTIFKGIKKLLPGEVIKFDLNKNITQSHNFELLNQNNILSDSDIEKTLIDAVKIRTISDVPYGVFLSSGIDSSLVAAILQSIKTKKIKSFSIGVKDVNYNEANESKKIANYIGTDHNELIIDEKDLIETVPMMSKIYGEPFADSSQIPTYILSKFAKNSITVALSGDGGDEIFCGYNRYVILNNNKKLIKILFLINKLKIPFAKFIKIFEKLNLGFLSKENLHKIYSLNKIYNFKDYYNRMVILSGADNNGIFKSKSYYNKYYMKNYYKQELDEITTMQVYDILNYLPDDILTKVDRASMANSLEVRSPLLDYRLTNLIFLNKKSKINSSLGKYKLRNMLKKYIDIELVSKKKKGFGIPIGNWLNSGLKEYSEDIFNSNHLINDPFLNSDKIKIIWENHKNGNYINSNLLWSIFIYINWKINNKL